MVGGWWKAPWLRVLLVFTESGLIDAVGHQGKGGLRSGGHSAIGVGVGLRDILMDYWVAELLLKRWRYC